MTNLLLLANVVSLSLAAPTTDFYELLNNTSQEEILFAKENSITNFDSYYEYLNDKVSYANSNSNGKNDSTSKAFTSPLNHLNENFPNYYWMKDVKQSALTSDVSNAIPIEMQIGRKEYEESEIKEAIVVAGVENKTSYGGCGPIAEIGILDYFARYLNYNEIINDPTSREQRVILASTVLSHSVFNGSKDETLVWPWDYRDTFNTVINLKGLNGKIKAEDEWTLFGGKKEGYWNKIIANIDEGLPVTLFSGLDSGNGEFAKHYTNIYGYETWVGVPNDGGDRLTKQFIKARLNWGRNEEYYCDADILNCGQTGLITYTVEYENQYDFKAKDFAEEYVNSNGNGQYFFYNFDTPVTFSNGKVIQTSRLRTSYIENQYLVLSPNRQNAGTAYLDLTFPHNVSRLSFDSSMWGSSEGAAYEKFSVQYLENGSWKDRINVDLNNLSTLKNKMDNFIVLFPKTTRRIRFYSTHSRANADRNKGRICLDNFDIKYH